MYEIDKDRLHNAPEKSVRARAHARNCTESEKTLEAKLRREVEKRGGMAIKFLSQLHRGLPDRIVLLPGGIIYFVELKTTTGRLSRVQKFQLGILDRLGCRTEVLWGMEGVTWALDLWGKEEAP